MRKLKLILPILAALAIGFALRGLLPSHQAESPQPKASIYTCSMHPQIQLPKPGKCPICFMDLIPLESGNDDNGEREVSVSPYAAKLMELETAPVERRFEAAEIRMVGRVDYDETRAAYISAWVPGRIDKLFVNSTGTAVNKGDRLAEFFSPDLLTAQEELLQAIKHNPSLVDSAREKLRLWGFTAEQISAIEKRGTASDHMILHAPASGIVIHKNAQEGLYVKTGTQIYTIADLSTVWVQLDAYESDLHKLHPDDPVVFTTQTHPGKTFEGTVSFIDPIVNPATRTAKVRVVVGNADATLKPGMFVRATVQAQPQTEEPPLLIPATAPLRTGKRAVVYVEKPNAEPPTYEGREITLGQRLGNFYVVKSGLTEGERVVIRGAFKLDAELQIQAKPSMMSMPSETQETENRELKPQTLCPIMGNAINKDVFTDYNGMRIYFCCGGCDSAFLKDPEKHLEQMRKSGVEPEQVEHAHEH